MIFKRKKSSGAVETESRENRNNSLEETLELTLTEVKELRAEMTMLRKELLGDRFMEPTDNHDFLDGQVDTLPGDIKEPVDKDMMLIPQHCDITVDVQQADIRSDSSNDSDYKSESQTVKVEGWATVDFKPEKNRRWWQFWKSKKSKYKENDLDFA